VAVRAVRCRAGSWLYKAEHLKPISVFRQPNQVQDIAAGLTVEPDEEPGINHREQQVRAVVVYHKRLDVLFGLKPAN
jgi:hypothetical protein